MRKYHVVTLFRNEENEIFVDRISVWRNTAKEAKQAVRDDNDECGFVNIETAIMETKQAQRIEREYRLGRPYHFTH